MNSALSTRQPLQEFRPLPLLTNPLLLLEPDVLEGRAGVQGDRVDRVFRDPRPHPYQAPQVHDRGEHDALDGELLNLVQQGFPFGAVALPPLLLEEFIELRIPPIRIGPLGVHERFHTRRSIARTPVRRYEAPTQLWLFGNSRDS